MSTISESELALVVRSKALNVMRIIQNEDGKFLVSVNLNNQEGDLDLVTFRKKPREWASLDTLVKHIQEKFGHIPAISLTLYSGEVPK